MGPAWERFRKGNAPTDTSHGKTFREDPFLHYCSNCKNCDIACPSSVPISSLIMEARATFPRTWRTFLRDWLLAHGETVGNATGLVPSSLRNFAMNLPPTRRLLALLGVALNAPLPAFAPVPFPAVLKRLPQPNALPRTVALFAGCYVNLYDPDCGRDIVFLLNRAGYRVVPTRFVCCGLPMVANGFAGDARRNAERNSAELDRLAKAGIPVLAPCPSCVLTLNEGHADAPPDTTVRTHPPVQDACAFLAECIRRGELPMPCAPPMRTIYHAPCHLRAQGIGLPGMELLSGVPGLSITYADAGCCGISGSYGFKGDKYPLGMSIGQELFTKVKESHAGVVVTECGTCRVQIAHGTEKPVRHPLSLLRSFFSSP
jgi:glycerol-3-phosphate dehydrogenase subunit C